MAGVCQGLLDKLRNESTAVGLNAQSEEFDSLIHVLYRAAEGLGGAFLLYTMCVFVRMLRPPPVQAVVIIKQIQDWYV